ncbi:PAS domain-containing sensor histidine kinase [Sphingomonas azotifigens]|uniref:PAS domain-containing sensor histidine kinase n=1 Tax=Sphingomonas azotifigens TaxID=330920 RepID=UPI000A04E70E|nr:PAS domain S-box protein [Sphingomonas azotifigens]
MKAGLVARHSGRAIVLTIATAVVLALCVFTSDMPNAMHGTATIFYLTAILLVARTRLPRILVLAGAACGGLTLIGWILLHWGTALGQADLHHVLSLAAVALTTLLVTGHHSAQAPLEEQARILELTHDTVIIRNAEDVIVYWNAGAERLYGWSREEALGRRSQEMLGTTFVAGDMPDLLASGSWSGEIARQRKEGDRILLASRWFPRLDAKGRPVGVIETSTDLTEARRAAAARRLSEERYRAIFNAACFPIWETDLSCLLESASPHALRSGAFDIDHIAAHAVVRNANHAAATLFGLESRTALIGRSLGPFYPPDQADKIRRIWADLYRGARQVEEEVQLVSADGRLVDILLRLTLPDGEDPWRRVLVMAVDMTEQKRAQARLVQAQAEMAHVARVTLLGQLAATIAHEVNQPLSAIITYAKSGRRWLKQETEQAPEVENCLDHIVASGARAADVIARVRTMARKSAPQQDRIDVQDLLHDTLALLQGDLQAKQVTVTLRVPANLPPIRADRVQIQQVLVNLLLNAEQAMSDKPVGQRRICVDIVEREGSIVLHIKDSGSGFEGDPERLFQPFFTTKAQGMGMGLSICRSIVEQHGGTLSAANGAEGGAVFHFALPVAQQQRQADRAA